MSRAARVIIAIAVPLIGAVALEVARPHQGAERAFVFVIAIAAAAGLAVAVTRGNSYPPSVAAAVEQAQDDATSSRNTLWHAFIAVLLVVIGLAVLLLAICGASF